MTFVPDQEVLFGSIAQVLADQFASRDAVHIAAANDLLRYERREAHAVEIAAGYLIETDQAQKAAALKHDSAYRIAYLGQLRETFLKSAGSPESEPLKKYQLLRELQDAINADCAAFDAVHPAVTAARSAMDKS